MFYYTANIAQNAQPHFGFTLFNGNDAHSDKAKCRKRIFLEG